jgi:hypothetical protein
MNSSVFSDRAWLVATALLIVFWMMTTHVDVYASPLSTGLRTLLVQVIPTP